MEAVRAERDDDEGLWASVVKLAMKRRNPGFNERAHGFSTFSGLLLEAQKRGLIKLDSPEAIASSRWNSRKQNSFVKTTLSFAAWLLRGNHFLIFVPSNALIEAPDALEIRAKCSALGTNRKL